MQNRPHSIFILAVILLFGLLFPVNMLWAQSSPHSALSRTQAVDTFDWLAIEKEREKNPVSDNAARLIQQNLAYSIASYAPHLNVSWAGLTADDLDEILTKEIPTAPVTPTLKTLLIDFLTQEPPASIRDKDRLMAVQLKHLLRLGYLRAAVDYYFSALAHNNDEDFHKYGLIATHFIGIEQAECLLNAARGHSTEGCEKEQNKENLTPSFTQSHFIGQLLQAETVRTNQDFTASLPLMMGEDLRQLAQKIDVSNDRQSGLSLFRQSTETDLSAEKIQLFTRAIRLEGLPNTELAMLFMPQMKKIRPREEFFESAPLLIAYFIANGEFGRAKSWYETFRDRLDWPEEISKILRQTEAWEDIEEKNPSFFIFFSFLWQKIMLKEYGQYKRIVYYDFDTLVTTLMKTGSGLDKNGVEEKKNWQAIAQTDQKLKNLPFARIEEARALQNTSRRGGGANAKLALLSLAALIQAEKLGLEPDSIGVLIQALLPDIETAIGMNQAFAVGREVYLTNTVWN